jgi:uncharacterized OsmC-like protein
MQTSEIKYQGDLRTLCTHLKSGKEIITDAPTDNCGKGEAFSPTDLLSTSLVSCMLTIMAITADKHGFKFEGVQAEMQKVMASNPRRVAEINVTIQMPNSDYDQKQKKLLEIAALNCPVAKSLAESVKQNVIFKY